MNTEITLKEFLEKVTELKEDAEKELREADAPEVYRKQGRVCALKEVIALPETILEERRLDEEQEKEAQR